MGYFFENGANFENGASFQKMGQLLKMGQTLKIWSARHMPVKYALSARESCAGIRASFRNDAPLVKCALSARESCAGIRASFRNDARTSNERGYAWFSGGPYRGDRAKGPWSASIFKQFLSSAQSQALLWKLFQKSQSHKGFKKYWKNILLKLTLNAILRESKASSNV